MKILITNRKMSSRWGSELYVRDLAIELLRRGHRPMVYCSELGAVADELLNATVPVSDDLTTFGVRPDVIHGQHHLVAMSALAYYGDVPMVGVSHGWRPWPEQPVLHPNVTRYVAVDEAVRDRLTLQHGVPDERVVVVPNFVDLDRFQLVAEPGPTPRRMLLFSNYVSEGSPYLKAAREAAGTIGAHLDVVGDKMGTSTPNPEKLLGEYDLVLAQGRSALEAIAAGATVMVGSSRAFGPLVRSDNVEHLRRLNFGIRAQTLPATSATILDQITGYDPSDAAAVTNWVRANTGVTQAVDALVDVYQAAVDTLASELPDALESAHAMGTFLSGVTRDVNNLETEVWDLRPRAARSDRDTKNLTMVQGERNSLRQELAETRKRLKTAERDLGRTKTRAYRPQKRLDALMGSRAVRAQHRVRSAPLLKGSYRAALNLLGRS